MHPVVRMYLILGVAIVALGTAHASKAIAWDDPPPSCAPLPGVTKCA